MKKKTKKSDATVFDGLNIPSDVLSDLTATIKRKMTPAAMKVRAAIDVTCFGDEGINAVKEALLIGEKMGTKENPIEVFILSFVFFIFFLLACLFLSWFSTHYTF